MEALNAALWNSGSFIVQWNNAEGEGMPGTFTAKLTTIGQPDQWGNVPMTGSHPSRNVPILKMNHGMKGLGGPIWADPTPLGVARIYEDNGALLATGEFDMENPIAKAYANIGPKMGADLKWSYTYEVLKSHPITLANGKKGRNVERAVVLECCPVFRPGGHDSRTVSFNSAYAGVEAIMQSGDEGDWQATCNGMIDHHKDNKEALESMLQRIGTHIKYLSLMAKEA